MQGDLKLVNINDERFWDILFEEACVEGQQATRIRNELEKIIAYDVEKVVERIKELGTQEDGFPQIIGKETAINVIRNGGKE